MKTKRQGTAAFGMAIFALTLQFVACSVLAQEVAPALVDKGPAAAPAAPAAETAVVAPAAPAPDAKAEAPAGAPAGQEAVAEAPAPQGSVIAMKTDRVTFEAATNAGGSELINVAVDNETLENVVSMFTKLAGANIVATSANLTGTVTVNLKGVDWKSALSSILDLHDLALIEKTPGSGVYSILPKPPPTSEPVQMETFFLTYTTVEEVKPVIANMLPTGSNAVNVTISEFPSRNAMVVKTTDANLREIRKLIESMDRPGKQVCVEAKFMELSDGASKQLGIRWDSLEEFGVKLGAGPFTYDRSVQKNKTKSSEQNQWNKQSNVDENKRLYDKNGNQIEDFDVTFVAPPGSSNYTEVIKTVPTRTITGTSDSGNNDINNALNTFNRAITEKQAAILELDTLSMVLSALKKTEGANVVSNPKIIVTSGSSNAFFSVGEREPIIKTEITRGTQDSPGDKITANLDTTIATPQIKGGYLETGIMLQVIPVAKTDEMIEASIYPRLVRLIGEKTVGENSWPRISVKEIKTSFTLRSGQTVAIGGLTDTSDAKQVTKVPFLGDIPLIGKYFFTHTSDAKNQVETIIFVTLSLARPDELRPNAGIPQGAELVQQRIIEDEKKKQDFDKKIEEMKKAAEAASEKDKAKASRKKR